MTIENTLQIPYNTVDKKKPRRCVNTPGRDPTVGICQVSEVYQPSLFDEALKVCRMCSGAKPLSNYRWDRHKNQKPVLVARCKDCERQVLQEWRARNPEKYKAQQRRSLENNRAKRLERTERWREKNREHTREYSRRYYEEHPEQAAEHRRKFKEENPDYWREWIAKNREKSRHYVKNRLARLRGAEGSHTQKEWEELCERYGYKCLCCKADGIALTRDHVIPISLGGANYIGNIQPLCHKCNRLKYVSTTDYREETGEQI